MLAKKPLVPNIFIAAVTSFLFEAGPKSILKPHMLLFTVKYTLVVKAYIFLIMKHYIKYNLNLWGTQNVYHRQKKAGLT